MKYARDLAVVAALMVALTLGTYWLLVAIYELPVAASTEAVEIDVLFNAHFFLIAFLFALVSTFMVYSIIRFRRRPGEEDAVGDQFHGNTFLEIAWTIVPLATVIFFGVWGTQILADITGDVEDEMVVRVIGQQWSWFFEYPELDDLRTTELVLPVDQTVRLEMESLDVLHSFWVPEFRVKQDLVPGQVHDLRITPTLVGEYKTRCAEICGSQHAYMLADVLVLSEADFDSWVQENSVNVLALSPAERGELWYTQFGCNACHSLDGTVLVGPTWEDLYLSERPLASGETVTADDDYLQTSMLEPNAHIVEGYAPGVMPQNYEERFEETEAQYGGEIDIVADLIAFIRAQSEETE